MSRRIYRSMQGKLVDMELLGQKHELAPAIGNIRVNARGDELGPGGQIVRRREDIMAEYYESNPNAARDESFVKPRSENPKQTATVIDEEIKEQTTAKRTTSRNKNN